MELKHIENLNIPEIQNIKTRILECIGTFWKDTNSIDINGISFFVESLKQHKVDWLFRYCILEVTEPKNARLVTIIGHAYMDFILNRIITKHKGISNKEKFRRLPFDLKATILYELNLIEEKTYQDLKYFTKIRNNFAHSITFEEQDIEIQKFTRFRNIAKTPVYTSMELKKGFKLALLKFQLILIIAEIFYKHDFLYLESEPKK